jgi:hypothetical protein
VITGLNSLSHENKSAMFVSVTCAFGDVFPACCSIIFDVICRKFENDVIIDNKRNVRVNNDIWLTA